MAIQRGALVILGSFQWIFGIFGLFKVDFGRLLAIYRLVLVLFGLFSVGFLPFLGDFGLVLRYHTAATPLSPESTHQAICIPCCYATRQGKTLPPWHVV